MLTKDKVLKLFVPFTKAEQDEGEEGITITGRASTNTEDRSGDIIASDAWKKSGALANYLKNPIVLAFHDPTKPIGLTISHEIDDIGLKITAKISKVAGDVISLIKEGILSAFSIGFMVKEANFDPNSGIFVIKELELFEVSVVSVPANQDTLFSIEKNFSNPDDYKEFRNQFIKSEESKETLMVDNTKDTAKDKPIDIEALVAQIASAVKSDFTAEKKAAEEAEKAEKDANDKLVATATTAAERLIKDLREEIVEKQGEFSTALADVGESLKALIANGELQAAFSGDSKNKMKYSQAKGNGFDGLTTAQKDGMFYASKIFGMKVEETKLFRDYVKKSGMEHWDAGVTGEWEVEYQTNIQNALREQLVVEPLFTTLPMATETLTMPINPEAGDATWVHASAYRSKTPPYDESDSPTASTGVAQEQELLEQTLIARKLATREYIGYEEEEDSIVALAPVINDAVARRMARASDLAFLRGPGTLTTVAYNPILGLEGRGANTTDVEIAGAAGWKSNVTEDDFVDMRRNLGLYGLDPSQLTLICSHDLYYEIMKLPNFKTVDVMGEKATIITGQVGALFGVPVLVSQMFDNAAITSGTVGTAVAIMVYVRNFVTGILRGILTESDKDVINQKRVIVSSRRFAFQDIITGEATVNLEIAS